MRFTKTRKVSASAAQVWKVFAHEFDEAHIWMASIPQSAGKPVGKLFDGAQSAGRVCELDGNPNGLKASEQFLAYDEKGKTCTVRIDFVNAPGVFPVDHNEIDFSVVDTGDNECEMTWTFRSYIKLWAFFLWPIIRIGFGVFVGQIIEELQYFIENAQPHPRKVKALEKARGAAAA